MFSNPSQQFLDSLRHGAKNEPTPRSIGKGLGVDDPYSTAYLTVFEGTSRERAKWNTSTALALTTEIKPTEGFWHEFSNLYLPTFLRAWREVVEPPEGGLRYLHDSVLGVVAPLPSFALYLRTQPDAVDLFPFFVRYFATRGPSYAEITRPDTETYFWRLEPLVHAFCSLMTHYDLPLPLSLPSDPASALHHHLVDIIERYEAALATPNSALRRITKERRDNLAKIIPLCRIARDVLGGEKFKLSEGEEWLEKIREELGYGTQTGGGGNVLVWRDCQASEKGGCKVLEEGERLLSCSKCKAVRYCSIDHQRLDWPNHKKICFKPSW